MEHSSAISVFTFKNHSRWTHKPVSELFATTMYTHTGEIIRIAFQSNDKEILKLCDSHITMLCTNNRNKPMEQWVQNRAVEINRFSQPSFVHSQDMIPD